MESAVAETASEAASSFSQMNMMSTVNHFQNRWQKAAENTSSLCVGIDPSLELLSAWGLEVTPAGLFEFSLRMLDAAMGQASVVKPQVAFFEALGPEGMQVLSEIICEAKKT